ncbi:MAG: GreA/GreB family elongation factor [Methylophilales bacterium]|nr:GreA/GreB family elongation factor [Methylophilales bacterium]
MSRAFLNEDKFAEAGDELVERPISAQPNYVTTNGFKHLQEEAQRLEALRNNLAAQQDDAFATQRKAEVERDLRYYSARLESAIVVDTSTHPQDEIRFGAIVSMEEEDGQKLEFAIVGEDEADIAQHKVGWTSPLAKALIGHKVGETIVWKRPAGNATLEIISIRYQ